MAEPRRRGALGLIVILALAACQSSASDSQSPSRSHGPSESEHGDSAEPSASGPATACDPGVVCRGPLAAGDYVSEGTGARIEFSLDDHGWSGLPETPGVGFGLVLADVPDAAISALAFVGEYFTDACRPDAGTSTIGPSPAAFMDMLVARTGVTATEPVEVEVAGRHGLQVDLTTAVDLGCRATGDGQIAVWPLPVGGPFDFEDMEQARVIAADGGSGTVILIAEARTVVEDYGHFLEHFTQLLETMTITPLAGDA